MSNLFTTQQNECQISNTENVTSFSNQIMSISLQHNTTNVKSPTRRMSNLFLTQRMSNLFTTQHNECQISNTENVKSLSNTENVKSLYNTTQRMSNLQHGECQISITDDVRFPSINTFVTNGLSHPYHWDESTFILGASGVNRHFYSIFR